MSDSSCSSVEGWADVATATRLKVTATKLSFIFVVEVSVTINSGGDMKISVGREGHLIFERSVLRRP